ncbi:hypothetical protein, conserved [Eimeria tenella]|uniref:HIT-type domain-containing protein n=1 Tax=Eimeria tenella TaxID=5802 RepID=U6KZ49_EIMTE|nr:hypothetical protein, conserved [Eimeria tenella]CDJ43246.1 hypothetical protein, conserved [Eimeria tenella]|eukprot:XP_013233996.1 hypothetical protein, conserved [Eimeria tenella]
MASSTDFKVCQVCKTEQHKYVCPKCKLLYCSLPCYKKHNSDCVSSFYESEFAAAAAAAAPTLHEKRDFNIKLTRFHLQQQQQEQQQQQQVVEGLGFDSSDEGDTDTDTDGASQQQQQQQQQIGEERLQQLQQLAAANELQLQHLTAAESAAFFSALKRGELAKYLEPWKPWWLSIELPTMEPPAHICCRPTRPDPRLAMTLAQVLFGYAHCMRTFNGATEDADVPEAAGHLLAVAKGLESRDPPPASAVSAVDQALEWAAQPPLGCTDAEFSEVCLTDAAKLLGVKEFAAKAAAAAAALIDRFKELMLQQQQQQQGKQQQQQQGERQQQEGEQQDNDSPQAPSNKQLAKLAVKAELVVRKLGFVASAAYYHWEELLQQRQQLQQALQQRCSMLRQLQQIKKMREEAQQAARALDSCGSTSLAAASKSPQSAKPVIVVPSSSSSSSSRSKNSSSSSSCVIEESFKREAD